MEINKGDYVTRNSYDNDTVFKVINIHDGVYYLKGVDVRLYADSEYADLVKCEEPKEEDIIDDTRNKKEITKSEYFFLGWTMFSVFCDTNTFQADRRIADFESGNTFLSLMSDP